MSTKERPAVEHYDRIQKDCLRKKWNDIKGSCHEVLFEDFRDFLDWCAESGWTYGLKLKRRDDTLPYCRENCIWEETKVNTYELQEMAKKWEAGVGPIREKLRPVLDRLAKEKQYGRTTVFRYEHPDLVREGIVFVGGEER